MRKWIPVVFVALAACGGGDKDEPASTQATLDLTVTVSQECIDAWQAYETATMDPAADADPAATQTLTACHTAPEWKKQATAYQGGILPANDKRDLDTILTGFCDGDPATPVCQSR